MEAIVWLLFPADLYPVSIIQGEWGGKVKICEVIVSVIMREKHVCLILNIYRGKDFWIWRALLFPVSFSFWLWGWIKNELLVRILDAAVRDKKRENRLRRQKRSAHTS
jgi:hypothetical protein